MSTIRVNPEADKGLTADQFEGLLRRLNPDREQAALQYESLRFKLIRFFEWNGCTGSEDLADETLDRVARKLPLVDILDVTAFAWGVAKRVRLEGDKKAARAEHLSRRYFAPGTGSGGGRWTGLPQQLSEHPGSDPAGFGQSDSQEDRPDQERFDCMRRCLDRLPARDRELFLAYYDARPKDGERRRRLAESMGVSVGALRVRVNRLRDKLERYMTRSEIERTRNAKRKRDA
jgi:RNA polymerase sigma factor (sigma-70 family)